MSPPMTGRWPNRAFARISWPSSNSGRWLVYSLATGALALLLYRTIWTAGWVYEDAHMLLAASGHPVRWLTRLTWQIRDPAWAHGLNLGLHLAVVGFMVSVSRRLGISRVGAGVVGLGLVVNPLAAQPVAYASSRGDLLVGLGVVVACYAVTWPAWWRWPVVLGGLALAGVSKESAVVGLLLVPLTLWVRPVRVGPQTWGWVIMSVALAGLAGFQYSPAAGRGLRGLVNVEQYSEHVTAPQWALVQSASVVRLLGVGVTGTGMTVDYDYDRVRPVWRGVSLIGLCGLAGFAWLGRRRWRLEAYAVAWILASVAPRLIVQTPRSYLNEGQFYVAFLGVMLLGGAVSHRLEARWSTP